jgi:hypothetical protein
MASKTRLANKTIWALENIVAVTMDGREHWRTAFQRAERAMDANMMHALAGLRDDLAEIERIARMARNGEYREK